MDRRGATHGLANPNGVVTSTGSRGPCGQVCDCPTCSRARVERRARRSLLVIGLVAIGAAVLGAAGLWLAAISGAVLWVGFGMGAWG